MLGHTSPAYSLGYLESRRLVCPENGLDLNQVLHQSGVGSGCSYSVCTPLPIPITYPLLFRESLGLRGELLMSTPSAMPIPAPPPQAGSRTSSISSGRAARGDESATAAGGGAGGGAGEMRVMCDQISGVAYAERGSTMGRFLGQVRLVFFLICNRSVVPFATYGWANDVVGVERVEPSFR